MKSRNLEDDNLNGECPNAPFEPSHFLKCHSAPKDKADMQTKVWQCAFEPDPDNPLKTKNTVATCGGNSVCVIDVETGAVKTKYYSEDKQDIFYTVAWTILGWDKKTSVLAVAGSKSTVHLLHPQYNIAFLVQKFSRKMAVFIASLLFHPFESSILFGAFSNGDIRVWDIGQPSFPNYQADLQTIRVIHLSTSTTRREIFSLSFSRHCEVLLCSTDNGVVGCYADIKEIKSKSEIKKWSFTFPVRSSSAGDSSLVDSVQPLEDGKIIATKCALHGVIYLWDLELAMLSTGTVSVKPTHILNWSNTDNYFMDMGTHPRCELLVCGDDKGKLWLYEFKNILSSASPYNEVSSHIEWPKPKDLEAESKWKVKQEVYDIVINKTAVSSDGMYIVAVTSTNLVCIWRKKTVKYL